MILRLGIAACAVWCILALSVSAAVIRVDANAPGPARDGATWATAYLTVGAGIQAASAGDEVWVATSLPAAPAYDEGITLKGGVSVFGGFSGVETERAQRDWRAHTTVLDGGGARRVALVPATVTTEARLDGFTVRNGRINENGAGVSILGVAALANCRVEDNVAALYGGGVYVRGTATISHTRLRRNHATWGGAVYIAGSAAHADIHNCEVSRNSAANYGSGVFAYLARATVTSCTISGNASHGFVAQTSAENLITLANSIVSFNNYGVVRYYNGTLILRNNNVSQNTIANYAGVIDPTGSDGNVKADPRYLFAPNANLRLQAVSPCVNAGDNGLIIEGDVDLDGKPRILGGRVDIGAYELDPDAPPPLSVSDAFLALEYAGGRRAADPSEAARLTVSSGAVKMGDALAILRALLAPGL